MKNSISVNYCSQEGNHKWDWTIPLFAADGEHKILALEITMKDVWTLKNVKKRGERHLLAIEVHQPLKGSWSSLLIYMEIKESNDFFSLIPKYLMYLCLSKHFNAFFLCTRLSRLCGADLNFLWLSLPETTSTLMFHYCWERHDARTGWGQSWGI